MLWGWLIPGWIKRGALALAGLALALLAAFGAGRREGRISGRAKASEDALKRADAGRKAAGKAKAKIDAGKTPEEIARENDGRW